MSAPEQVGKDLMKEREELLRNSIPVYRFQPDECIRLSELEQGRLWLSDPARFNDLWDLNLPIENRTERGPYGDAGPDRLKSVFYALWDGNPSFSKSDRTHAGRFYSDELLDVLQNWIAPEFVELKPDAEEEQLIKAFKDRMKQFGVACFTSDWRNRLMWAHYASSHQGFCIEYSVIKNKVAADDNSPFQPYQVQYLSEVPELCLSELLFSPHQAVGRYLATKHVDWAYEKEWRLVSFEHQGECAQMPDGMQISALIAGRKMPVALQAHLQQTASRLGVPALKTVNEHGEETLTPF
ncbi:DUF2971 domain-containing protein [Crenobacter intestini]|uniref:DUF2971 domain-containing protein n=1 Tax=Crenobacter intestini TaxID=2563443 RepID=A0A4T0UJA3_9NEIS|nr:DUF2971 domain-containing protein [Crenobacter intestini]TIC78612.1 DUF2971 domain-containing protein [Crenobacter intestini]